MRRLGLIGGLGPGATAHYYRELAKADPGEMLLIHAEVDAVLGMVARGERQALADELARLIERLANGGAEVAAISAITPHFAFRELERISPLPLVNAVAETAAELRARNLRRVALFGTRFVVRSRLFGMLAEFDVVVSDEVDAIHDAYMGIVGGGQAGKDDLCRIAQDLLAQGRPVEAVVLAGTDLSLVFDEATAPFPAVDASAAHIRAILRTLSP